jgi:hypothetical protein
MAKIYILRLLYTFILVLMVTVQSKSQDEKVKAIFVYNFTKFINWPQKPGKFVIIVMGRSAIFNEIEGIASKKTVGSTAIEVKIANSPEEITDSHIIYIPASKTITLPFIVEKSIDKHILIITEKADACKTGSGINFVNKDGKLSFEISKVNIESCGLGVSTDLLKLGTVVKY